MAHKYDDPPAYAGSPGPQAPPQAYYHNQGQQAYGSPAPGGPGPYGPPPGQYYQPGPQMGYYPPQQHQPYPQQGGYYPAQQPQGYYQDDRRRGPGFMEACLASLACCCCLDCLLF
ncbi:hypothetical protein CONLIGDRAFT_678588 [Coniochaeta ligniaria NRRL 30616]|uniref:Uncharacterized protein n=1 Tax=Coniochaeta ligniaria NRRL 30616 TaxID=1408157 RepID=A0A1J7IWU4_9PEZI|nr:hypothetical protein CONLIGDRAFT_678588 [Coniochaeta ligniaria NRRL 30616]